MPRRPLAVVLAALLVACGAPAVKTEGTAPPTYDGPICEPPLLRLGSGANAACYALRQTRSAASAAARAACRARCIDPTCAGATGPQPQVCRLPCDSSCGGATHYQAFLEAPSRDRIELAPLASPVLAYAEGTDGVLFATGRGELFFVAEAAGAFTVTPSFFPSAEGLLPVAGREGPATFLLTNERELIAAVDRSGTRRIRPHIWLSGAGYIRASHLQASWSARSATPEIHLRWEAWLYGTAGKGPIRTAQLVPEGDELSLREGELRE